MEKKMVVGLGNPGDEYSLSRHNIGWLILDQFSRRNRISLKKKKFKSLYGEGSVAGKRVVLLKPLVYMNRSGESMDMALKALDVDCSDMIVVQDDIDLAFGKLRFRRSGGDGGHKGIRSTIEELGTEEFTRLKFGVGRPDPEQEASDYVLDDFMQEETDTLNALVDRAVDALMTWIVEGLAVAMNRFHR